MADETVAPVVTATPETPTPTATPAEAKNTETPAEVMIPKSRFDEVNNRLKTIEAESGKATKAAKDAEIKRLEEEGKYKELFEKQQAELLTAQQTAKAHELRLLQRDAAAQTSLPSALADRLKGETIEEMIADAKAIMAAWPKPQAPNINANSGAGGAPAAGQLDEAEKKRIADKYGVDARYVQ